MEHDSKIITARTSLRGGSESQGLAGVSSASDARGEMDDPVDLSVREYFRLRPGLLQLLAKHGVGPAEGHSHFRLGEAEERRKRFDTGLHPMKIDCCKIVAYVAVIGAIGSFVGWYWDELLTCLSRPVQEVRFGPALLWCVLATFVIRAFNRLFFKN